MVSAPLQSASDFSEMAQNYGSHIGRNMININGAVA
jgi:hypothetical protein